MENTFYTHVTRIGDNILFRGYVDGEQVNRRIKYQPELFTLDPAGAYRSLHGHKLRKHELDSMSAARDFLKQYEGLEDRVFGMTDYVTQYIQKTFPGKIEYDPDLIYVCPIDIEVNCQKGFPDPLRAEWPVDSLTMRLRDGTFFVITTLDWDPEKSEIQGVKIKGYRAVDEEDLLSKFLEVWSADYPDVVTGWNIRPFDITYLVNRIPQVLSEASAKRLSPWGRLEEGGFTVRGRTQVTYEMTGVVQLDYLDIFKKFAYAYPKQESYKLDHIAHVVLGEKKLSYDEYDSFHDLRDKNPQKYCDYNLKDTVLISKMEDKLGIIDLVIQTAYKAGTNYQDTLGTTKIWDTIIYRYLDDKHVVIPPRKAKSKGAGFEGAFVKEPAVGVHSWVTSFDLASLYPNIIVEYNMSPETLVGFVEPGLSVAKCLGDWMNTSDYSVAANGVGFEKTRQGILPQIIVGYYDERKAVKKIMLEAKQAKEKLSKDDKEAIRLAERTITRTKNSEQAIKILLNSLYGACGSEYFRYFDLRMAEAITLSAQLTILTAEKCVNQLLNRILGTSKDYILAIDTDSLYVNLNPLVVYTTEKFGPPETSVVDFLSDFSAQIIQPELDQAYEALHKKMGSRVRRMEMKREAIADKGFWTAKKRYALRVLDNEGVRYAEPDLKIMGIEAIKSSTPEKIRDWLKEAFQFIMNDDQPGLHKFVAECEQKFKTLTPEEMGTPISVSTVATMQPDDGFPKGTPQNSKAAGVYNKMISVYGLEDRFPLIVDEDQIKILNLRTPNPSKHPIIAFPEMFPREFDLEKYINIPLQFQKTFMAPLEAICKAIRWSAEETSSLESFF